MAPSSALRPAFEKWSKDEVQILVNNFPIARGTVVVNANRIAVEIKEMLPRAADQR